MYKGKRILGLIPARGGSKGLSHKNILPLLGKPLIAWTIEQATSSNYLDRIIVSTDDDEISELSKRYGAEVPFVRPKELAEDTTPMAEAIFHAVNFLKDKGAIFDYVALLEPTSPLRKKTDIDNAIKLLVDNETRADSLISVGEVHLEHPAIMKTIAKGYVKNYETFYKNAYRRQNLDRVYFPYGVIYISKTEKLIELKTFYQKRTIPCLIERWQNYEIDDIYDFICSEAILTHKMAETNL